MLAHSGPIYSQSREACCIRCLNKLLRVVVKTPWTIYVVRRVSQPFCSLSFVLRITSSKRPANGIHTLNRVCSCVGMLGTRYLFDCHHSMRKNAPLSPPLLCVAVGVCSIPHLAIKSCWSPIRPFNRHKSGGYPPGSIQKTSRRREDASRRQGRQHFLFPLHLELRRVKHTHEK